MGINEAIVEKDFWVCWTLAYLFHASPWQDNFSFKGGTSLSKSYNLIQRFSEDIDLVIDWTLLGYRKDEPWEARSTSGQERFNHEANERALIFLRETFAPELQTGFSGLLGKETEVSVDAEQNVFFHYPKSLSNTAILQAIRLEIGPLAAWVPSENRVIKPYAAEQYPAVFTTPETSVRTVMAKRTFWEKATILHQEAHRDETRSLPLRYSRHYYDLYRMAKSPVKDEAFRDLPLLNEVIAFKRRFYRCPWAKYEEALPGSLLLMPPACHVRDLEKDYQGMQSMLFGEKPTFNEIMDGLEALEREVNALRG
jgi:hypothetical protein